MGLRAPKQPPKDTADWDRWTRDVEVLPDEGSVTTERIAPEAVTEPKQGSNSVSNRVLRDSAAHSVIGRAAGTSGDPADITVAEGQFLGTRSGVTDGFTLLDSDIPLTLARTADVPAATTGLYTGAFTGTTTDPAPPIRWSKIGPMVLLYLPSNTAVSNSTGFTITGAPLNIRPARDQPVLAVVHDNSVNVLGKASMGTNGTITFSVGVAGGAFTNSGAKGIATQTLAYSLD